MYECLFVLVLTLKLLLKHKRDFIFLHSGTKQAVLECLLLT